MSSMRHPQDVMRLSRLGAMFPTRLSFMRVLLRNLRDANAVIERTHWAINDDGFGEAVYTLRLGEGDVSLFAMTRPLEDEYRSDRVIATAWDAAFVLYDGVPDAAEIQRLIENAPYQEAGRFTENDLVLSRANKSVRTFQHIIDTLKAGGQPDPVEVAKTGYLMRTTAVYGNGKFGISDHSKIRNRPILGGAFMAEMTAVWLIRGFTHDLAEFLGGGTIDPTLKRHLGVGNATGLGMAPYLVSHPHLVHSWFATRERALAEVMDLPCMNIAQLGRLCDRIRAHLAEWNVSDALAMAQISRLRTEFDAICPAFERDTLTGTELLKMATFEDMEELLVSMMLEAHPECVDQFAPQIATAPGPKLNPAMDAVTLRELLGRDWTWALDLDYNETTQAERFWYVSEEKLEPRIGLRFEEPGAELESPLDIARRVSAMAVDIENWGGNVGMFLLDHPQHRMAVHRVQGLADAPYSEIRDNLIARTCRPIDMLRSKLAMFGASKFDPKSDLWTRITLAQGAPLLHELNDPVCDDWWLAALS